MYTCPIELAGDIRVNGSAFQLDVEQLGELVLLVPLRRKITGQAEVSSQVPVSKFDHHHTAQEDNYKSACKR